MQEVKKRFPEGVPLLHPVKDMKIKDESFDKLVNTIEMFEKRLYEHPLHSDPELESLYNKYTEKLKVPQLFFYQLKIICKILG